MLRQAQSFKISGAVALTPVELKLILYQGITVDSKEAIFLYVH